MAFGSQLFDDSGTKVALRRKVEGVGVGNNRVVSLLLALVVGNAAVKVASIIVVDGVAIHFRTLLVDIKWRRTC